MAHQKITFKLEADEDGYPPVAYERLWAEPTAAGNMRVDSIPFYVTGISLGDEVVADRDESGELWFRTLARPSNNSTFRIAIPKGRNTSDVRKILETLGCESEVDESAGLIACNVPGEREISPILSYLIKGKERADFDFEEGALRHPHD